MATRYYESSHSGEQFDKAIDYMLNHEKKVNEGIIKIENVANAKRKEMEGISGADMVSYAPSTESGLIARNVKKALDEVGYKLERRCEDLLDYAQSIVIAFPSGLKTAVEFYLAGEMSKHEVNTVISNMVSSGVLDPMLILDLKEDQDKGYHSYTWSIDGNLNFGSLDFKVTSEESGGNTYYYAYFYSNTTIGCLEFSLKLVYDEHNGVSKVELNDAKIVFSYEENKKQLVDIRNSILDVEEDEARIRYIELELEEEGENEWRCNLDSAIEEDDSLDFMQLYYQAKDEGYTIAYKFEIDGDRFIIYINGGEENTGFFGNIILTDEFGAVTEYRLIHEADNDVYVRRINVSKQEFVDITVEYNSVDYVTYNADKSYSDINKLLKEGKEVFWRCNELGLLIKVMSCNTNTKELYSCYVDNLDLTRLRLVTVSQSGNIVYMQYNEMYSNHSIGMLSELKTVNNTLVGAINEIYDRIKTLEDKQNS